MLIAPVRQGHIAGNHASVSGVARQGPGFLLGHDRAEVIFAAGLYGAEEGKYRGQVHVFTNGHFRDYGCAPKMTTGRMKRKILKHRRRRYQQKPSWRLFAIQILIVIDGKVGISALGRNTDDGVKRTGRHSILDVGNIPF